MAHQVRMPRLSQDMAEGRIVAWLKQEGDAVQEGEPLLSIETDKAEVEVQAPKTGILRRILAHAGDDVAVGTAVGIVGDPGEDIEALVKVLAVPTPPTPARAATGSAAPAASRSQQPGSAPTGKRQPVSPAAKRLAREMSVDLARVAGTGPGGLVTESDVRAAASHTHAPTAAPAGDRVEVIPVSAIRRRTAERLALSRQTAADVTTVVDVDMTGVAAHRQGTGAAYTAYVVWATAQGLREFPILNASLDGNRVLVKKDIHLGVAVAMEHGLVVPVVRHADQKSVEQISREMDALAARARDGQLGPGELSGSTFTVTNSGAFGSLMFTPIINLPEVAILGMGKVADTPAVRGGQIVVRKIMYLCLSYDHRVVDGAPAVQFLQVVKGRLEQVGA
jgi:pyruvate dehydrogenase E2 component (dihydrolipoamide acetyltransferase)